MEIPLIPKRMFSRFRKYLPARANAEKVDARVVLSCSIWVKKSGASWSQIPEKYGKADTIRKRFSRWSKAGIFRRVFENLARRFAKNRVCMVDSTTVKVHRTAASLASDGAPRQIGRSAGGLTTKIHLIANSDGLPLAFALSPGNASDLKEGEKLIGKHWRRIKFLLADKAYDADRLRGYLEEKGINACLPPKSNRKNPVDYDEGLYRKRATIEIMFGRLKDWRGIAMRYVRCAHIFDSAICLALTCIFF